ncbi:MAG: hypothetical protein PVJ01_06295 [Pseudomonadota bacterium]|jgi:hypothetical protein
MSAPHSPTIFDDALTRWLLEGDISLQYQVERDLFGAERSEIKDRIANEGWGARFLGQVGAGGYWGKGFYNPKWTSTHYTLLDLKNLGIGPGNGIISKALGFVLNTRRGAEGGLLPTGRNRKSDICVNGMFLNYASYFKTEEKDLEPVVDLILHERMADGGFNCESNKRGARHSSMHTTISVLEGILEYSRGGYNYGLPELKEAEKTSREFLLNHRLFRSHRTGELMDPKMLMLSWPSRWRYDILRVLDYFQDSGTAYDQRMQDALEVLVRKRRADGRWPLQGRHPGQVHFEMEKTGKPSRVNTLRALRVLKHFTTA